MKAFPRIVVATLLLCVLWTAAPAPASAQTLTVAERNALILQINSLIEEINRLQALLDEQRAQAARERTLNDDGTYQTVFYNDEVEAIYAIEDGELVTTQYPARTVDRELFAILTDTLGSRPVERYVREFRVFDDDTRDIGAFVELKIGTDDWIVGANRNSYSRYHDEHSDRVQEIYQQLFIHEYAHILGYYDNEIIDAFTDEFWDRGDWRHSDEAKEADEEDRFEILSDYYHRHEDEFLNDYATIHPDEDFAESFVEYVMSDRLPRGDDEVYEKVRFFEEYEVYREAREDLRQNIGR